MEEGRPAVAGFLRVPGGPGLWAAGQVRQVSFSVTLPPAGTVAVRLAPVSQVTFPAASLRMYLYENAAPAGRVTSSFHTG